MSVTAGEGEEPVIEPVGPDVDGLRLQLTVTARPGTWTLAVNADGPLVFAADGQAKFSTTFVSNGNPVFFAPLLRATGATGTALLRASAGTSSTTRSVKLAANSADVRLCRTTGGICIEPSDAGVPDPDSFVDGGSAVYTLGSPGSALHDGDGVVLGVWSDAGPTALGATWTFHLTATPPFFFGDGRASDVTVVATTAAPVAFVAATVRGTGEARVSAATDLGRRHDEFFKVDPARDEVRRVDFRDYVGLAAQNRVLVCSTRRGGMVTFVSSQGTVAPTSIGLRSATAGECPVGYFGVAETSWTGTDREVVWNIGDGAATSTTSTRGMLGTAIEAVTATLAAPPTWIAVEDGRATVVDVLVKRQGYPDTTKMVSVDHASVAAIAAPGVTVAPSKAISGADGRATFQVTAPAGSTPLVLSLQIDQRVTLQVTLPP